MLTIYHLYHPRRTGYDRFTDFVVAAESESKARSLVPCADECRCQDKRFCAWRDSTKTHCYVLGTAAPDVEEGVITKSFDAG